MCVWVCWQSCTRTPRTHSAEGRVPGAGCGVYASTPTHFLSHYAHSDFASPSQQSRETPFCQYVDEIQRNQALCKTRLSLAQTRTVLAAGTGLEAFPRGLNCDELPVGEHLLEIKYWIIDALEKCKIGGLFLRVQGWSLRPNLGSSLHL